MRGALNNLEVFNLFRRTIKKLFFLYAEQGNALAQSNLGPMDFDGHRALKDYIITVKKLYFIEIVIGLIEKRKS
ncbi:MAG: hypothetical protein HOL75_06960 [Nitrospina sp.]|nr:hypothetical protein [Nitrospina sp.]